MREFTHQIKFEDVIAKTHYALLSINPTVTVGGEKIKFSSVKGNKIDDIVFNTLISTGFHIIHELEDDYKIKTSIEGAELDVKVDDLLRDKIFRKASFDQMIAEVVENLENIATGVND